MRELVEGLGRWFLARRPDVDDVAVAAVDPPGGGYSAELLFADVELARPAGGVERHEVVVRLAPKGPPVFPGNDLGVEAAVQRAAAAAGVPVAAPVEHEADASWLGRAFLLQPRVPGRHPTDVPALAPWLQALSPAEQRAVHDGFLDALAAVHRVPLDGGPLVAMLRDGRDLAAEVRWWRDYARWACDGACDPAPLVELVDTCARSLPAGTSAPSSLLWGDVRLGNVVVGDDLRPAAVLDWEMATSGPAESDVAWFTALTSMTEHFVGTRLPGAPTRDEVVAGVESRLGRPLADLDWHERFAVVRAAAISIRTGVVATGRGRGRVPDPATDGVVAYARSLLGVA